jgi:hypothetical protein
VDGAVGIVTRLGFLGLDSRKGQDIKRRDQVLAHTGFFSLRTWGPVAEGKATGSLS